MKLFAKTMQGLEPLLKQELEDLGASEVLLQKRGIDFEGDEETLYRILINTRLALRVLVPIAVQKIADEQELYDFVRTVNWHDHITMKNTLAVDCLSFHEKMNHEVFLSQKCKDGIVDQFRDTFGVRPNVSPKNPDVLVNVHIAPDGECHLALDASGRSLNQRGYRVSGGIAPLNEVLAAGLIKMSSWDSETPFLDPFCGSGTLLIEAALMAKRKPPGLLNERFGIRNWAGFRNGLWTMMINEAKSRVRRDVDWIEGSDRNPRQVDIARENIRKARLTRNIRARVKPFDAIWVPEEKGTIVSNLPFGERVGDKTSFDELYEVLAKKLKFKARGYRVCFLTADPEFKDKIRLTPEKVTPVMNGNIPCEFVEFLISEEDQSRPSRMIKKAGKGRRESHKGRRSDGEGKRGKFRKNFTKGTRGSGDFKASKGSKDFENSGRRRGPKVTKSGPGAKSSKNFRE